MSVPLLKFFFLALFSFSSQSFPSLNILLLADLFPHSSCLFCLLCFHRRRFLLSSSPSLRFLSILLFPLVKRKREERKERERERRKASKFTPHGILCLQQPHLYFTAFVKWHSSTCPLLYSLFSKFWSPRKREREGERGSRTLLFRLFCLFPSMPFYCLINLGEKDSSETITVQLSPLCLFSLFLGFCLSFSLYFSLIVSPSPPSPCHFPC